MAAAALTCVAVAEAAGKNFCVIVVKAFTNCWSSYLNLQVRGLSKSNFLVL